MFVSLHNHSQYSNTHLLDCIVKPKDLVNRAITLGFGGVALTDHDCLSGAVELLRIRDEIKEKNPDFKIILGNEIYLIDETEIKNTNKYYHFILLAKDLIGWEQLKQLSTRAWQRYYFEKGVKRTPTTNQDIEEIVGKNPGHLLCSTACLGGRLNCCILNHQVKEANDFVRWCIKVFGKQNVALELQPSDSEEQVTVNKVLIKMANHYDVRYIVTTDTHYLEKEDAGVHGAFINSRQSSDREVDKFYKYTYMMDLEEVTSLLKLSDLSENEIANAINNTSVFVQDIENYDFRRNTVIPAPKVPSFQLKHLLAPWYDKYSVIDFYAHSSNVQDLYLIYQIEQGIVDKKITIDDFQADRINKELDVLKYISDANDQPMSGYLNLVKRIEDIIWKSSVIGVSRGSAMSFYINYLIGIVQANPLQYNIDYWRFLNKARSGVGNYPDVDIDIAPSQTDVIMDLLKEHFGENRVINCATFKTESLKSAVLTSARGMGLNNDEAQALAGMVPVYRGKVYSLKTCLEGDEELGLPPAPQFIQRLQTYPGLFETVQKIEGLISGSGIHASAVYISQEDIVTFVPCMRAPNGTLITAMNMHDSDECGVLKFDLLRTEAEEKIMKCIDMLLKDGRIVWQGDLKSTYSKYLHPDNLVYDNSDMWKAMADGKVTDLFQFIGEVGQSCIRKTRPENIKQMGAANAVMRLQASGEEESPIDRYVRFRNDIGQWYLEMAENGLTGQEIHVLEKYLGHKFGCAVEQEDVMLLLMDPEVAGFSLKQADHARKIIAKKKLKDVAELEKEFFGSKSRPEFLHYVWDMCIKPQLGYSFSIPHDIGYSLIGWQEVNLATRWNPLYWQCACLCINAGNYTTDLENGYDVVYNEEDDTEDTENDVQNGTEEQTEAKKDKRVAPNYGKIAKAISDAQLSGVRIELPDINTSQADFVPDVENNAILYSLQAINVVNPDLMERIIQNRPYASIDDFMEKVQPEKTQMVGLIKAGCFDSLYNEPRSRILHRFFGKLAEELHPLKDKLTKANMLKGIELGLNLSKYQTEIRMYKFKKYLDKNCRDTSSSVRRYIIEDEQSVRFFNTFVKDKLNITKNDYTYLDNQIAIREAPLSKLIDNCLSELMAYLNSSEGLNTYRELEINNEIKTLEDKFAIGSVASWEMDTMCFYHEPHELSSLNEVLYNIKNFEKLPEYPTPRKVMTKSGTEKDVYDLCTVAGTVIANNNTKHTVTILTKHGVVDLKMFAQLYTDFNQKYSTMDPKKPSVKIVIDDSWFKRGKLIIAHGFRRENMFNVRVDRAEGYARSIGLIESISTDGTANIRYHRKKRLDK